jgi:hypothetical protein
MPPHLTYSYLIDRSPLVAQGLMNHDGVPSLIPGITGTKFNSGKSEGSTMYGSFQKWVCSVSRPGKACQLRFCRLCHVRLNETRHVTLWPERHLSFALLRSPWHCMYVCAGIAVVESGRTVMSWSKVVDHLPHTQLLVREFIHTERNPRAADPQGSRSEKGINHFTVEWCLQTTRRVLRVPGPGTRTSSHTVLEGR